MDTVWNYLWFAAIQLCEYGILFPLAASILCALVSLRFGWIGCLLFHCVLSIILVFLDLQWLDRQVSKQGWEGSPDMDGVFMLGVVMRLLLFNVIMVPIGLYGLWQRRRLGKKYRGSTSI